MRALGGHDHHYPQFSSYVFTDISTGFFEKAQTKFQAWGSLITYKALNIEDDLKMQGFDEEEAYDIIVAANVLHATHNMDHTMGQVGRLLKTGGKLILVEGNAEGHHIHGEFVFGLVPGWWMGKQYKFSAPIELILLQVLRKDEIIPRFFREHSGHLYWSVPDTQGLTSVSEILWTRRCGRH